MNQYEEVYSGRIDTPYHHDSPFAEERACYLAHLLVRGWARATVNGTACKLAGPERRLRVLRRTKRRRA